MPPGGGHIINAHAQREACEAYIASQRSESWVLVRDQYDDGGISGGTLERPGLKRLPADIEDGLVDVIVCYKIDRLSRSLMEFSKLVEVFDRNCVTFVLVTQSFNTTTSMGRLTLNILLSFAQFEREGTAERIRDKVRASRMKGMWMGGCLPLGNEVNDRKLIENSVDAAHAGEIEAAVIAQLRAVFLQPEIVAGTWKAARARDGDIAEADTREALMRLDPLGDELFPAEQARIVTLLVEQVDICTDGLNVRLRMDVLTGLAREMMTNLGAEA